MSRQLARMLAALAVTALALLGVAVATPALAGPGTNSLRANETLASGQSLVTANGLSLVMQADGKLVEYAPGNRAVWGLATNRPGTALRMLSDGNAVLVAPGNIPLWSTRTAGNPGATLELRTDGSLVVYSAARVVKWTNGVRITTPTPTPTSTPTPTPTTPPTPPPTTTPAPAPGPAAEVVTRTNTERTRAGCAALRTDSRLTTAAQGHATDMATRNYFSHTSLDGRTFDRRIRDAGYPSPGGENIARGQTTPAAVMTAWMGSTGHRANILNCAFTAIGVGYDTRGHYWVQNFGY